MQWRSVNLDHLQNEITLSLHQDLPLVKFHVNSFVFLWGCTQTERMIDKPTWLCSLYLDGGNYWTLLNQLLDDDVDVSFVTSLAVWYSNQEEAFVILWLNTQSIFTPSRRSYAIVAVCLSDIQIRITINPDLNPGSVLVVYLALVLFALC